ncbi:hypothetical protein [Nocardia testacea]|uniref:hypothetical protein n=1 Tax=Nocardia testacea TaxID=248551 RepID=UPI0002E5E5E5|nr:hypothetical protein [Nocardia testacea]
MTRLNTSLPSLPPLTTPRCKTLDEWHRRLDERCAAALKIAENTTNLAERLIDDPAACRELLDEAHAYLEEAHTIDSMRKNPVLPARTPFRPGRYWTSRPAGAKITELDNASALASEDGAWWVMDEAGKTLQDGKASDLDTAMIAAEAAIDALGLTGGYEIGWNGLSQPVGDSLSAVSQPRQ